MLVYSITSRSSFEEAGVMHDWITRIRDQEMPVVSAIVLILAILAILAILILEGQAVCMCVCVCEVKLVLVQHCIEQPLPLVVQLLCT